MKRKILLCVLVAFAISIVSCGVLITPYVIFRDVPIGVDHVLRNNDFITSAFKAGFNYPSDANYKRPHKVIYNADPIVTELARYSWEEMPKDWVKDVTLEGSPNGHTILIKVLIPLTYTHPKLNQDEFVMWDSALKKDRIYKYTSNKDNFGYTFISEIGDREAVTESTKNKRFELSIESGVSEGASTGIVASSRVYIETGRTLWDRINNQMFWLGLVVFVIVVLSFFVKVGIRREPKQDSGV
jgi:putative Ca2+/H+ antiporter (TMEM165/GDT1 family)